MSTMRSARRKVAKARMAALGIERINRTMTIGRWRQVLTGDLAEKAAAALCPPKKPARRIRRISDAAKD